MLSINNEPIRECLEGHLPPLYPFSPTASPSPLLVAHKIAVRSERPGATLSISSALSLVWHPKALRDRLDWIERPDRAEPDREPANGGEHRQTDKAVDKGD